MFQKHDAQQDGALLRAGKWSTAAAVVGTAAAQHFVDPASTLATALHHANTGALWGLGFQLLYMLCATVYGALPTDGSITVSWRVNDRKRNSGDAKKKDEGKKKEKKKDETSENGEHDA
ncbi:hypothetical protein ABT052_29090 [Streptomyces sp. NPDC002766]|uniref:hypothetical protein n=1 Tax=Streptomyces sp. NPDC002766 TaxID=3154429 RepID=UPI0033252436